MSLDSEQIKKLELLYFWDDSPVPFELQNKDALLIYPISLKDSMAFLSCCDILTIKKDEINSIEIIQMSYLEFICKEVLKEQNEVTKLVVILKLCLGFELPRIICEDDRYFLKDDKSGIVINSRQFDDIRRIIMYQNIVGYDDSYINPEVRESMEETKELKSKGIDMPSIERKIAIITSHCGIPKREQLEMSFRSHELLFQEVTGEIEFITTRPVAIYSGNGDKIDHWIYRKKKTKYGDFFSSVSQVEAKFGNRMVSN